MPQVPRGAYDQPLNFIVTERAIFRFSEKNGL